MSRRRGALRASTKHASIASFVTLCLRKCSLNFSMKMTRSLSSQITQKLLPTMASGIERKSTPKIIASTVTALPSPVLGLTSPYPT